MIRVMTDNAANLPPELREQYGIRELCLTYTIDGEPVDISKPFDGHAFYEAMRKGAEVKTSMITPLAAREAMEPVLDRGDDVLYVGLSGGVSGTCWGVGLVARELAEQYPERKIRVLDTRGASLGEGLIVLAAAPPRKDEIMRSVEYYEKILPGLGVKVELNHVATAEDLNAADAAIVAVGAHDVVIPVPGADSEKVVSSWDVLAGKVELTGRVAVIGGGLVGTETAEYLLQHGCEPPRARPPDRRYRRPPRRSSCRPRPA